MMSKKFILFSILLLVGICSSIFSNVSAMTEAEKQALIAQITAEIARLQAEINEKIASGQGGVQNSSSWCHTFDISMKYGDSGVEVSALQKALQLQGFFSLTDSEKIGSFFGKNTTSAVISFQEKYKSEILTPIGLSKGTGTVASFTRAKLNKLYGCSNVTPPVLTNLTCNPNWQCSSWKSCLNGQQTRSCFDYNSCNANISRPSEVQACSSNTNLNANTNPNTNVDLNPDYIIDLILPPSIMPISNTNIVCNSNWQCESWGGCINGQKTRSCIDYNYCNSNNYSKIETQTCSFSPLESICYPNWQTGVWSVCANYQQTRTVTDLNYCGTLTNKPLEIQSCCSSNWICSDWSACISDQQLRSCYDANRCSIATDRPTTQQPCTCLPNWQCDDWSGCYEDSQTQNGRQDRNCYDTNSCGIEDGQPITTQSCCISNWQCENWGQCYNGNRERNCTDVNYCSTPNNEPEVQQSCINAKIDIKANGSDDSISLPAGSPIVVNLTWSSVGNVFSCRAYQNWSGSKEASGSEYTSSYNSPLLGTYIYQISCAYNDEYGVRGSVSDSVTVNYIEPSLTMSINGSYFGPVQIYSGNAVAISWKAENAISCTASGDWSGNKLIVGTEYTPIINSSKIYTLTCQDIVGNKKSISINVNVIERASIKANNSSDAITISPGSVNIQWTSDANYCNASGNSLWHGYKSYSGSVNIYIYSPETYLFRIDCSNGYSDSIQVTVTE
ncbi:MAG: hypothetical protein A2463_01670 [Candidatus Staskawiczbacteria bacterium RIFOXYC2_FULL_32_10]|nr:MAG: hypothetical protein A2463_01670 [Candidatus Staskawiczbacteria bacterium RIFOXYC2_FULL_32_10]